MTTAPRPDLATYEAMLRMDDADLARGVRDLLGATLTAYIAGVDETRTVRDWAEGTRAIGISAVRSRLQTAYRAACLIADRNSPRVAQAWFQGLNPALDDVAPARMLLEADGQDDAGARVLAAARQFAAVG